MKVTVSLRASAWGLLPCSGNHTRQGRRARKRRSLRKPSSQFPGLWRRDRLEDKGKVPLKGIITLLTSLNSMERAVKSLQELLTQGIDANKFIS